MPIWRKSKPVSLEISSGLNQGDRDYQQDSVENFVIEPGSIVCAVLSDGMGGHKYGNIASNAIVNSCIKSLKSARSEIFNSRDKVPGILKTAANVANRNLSTIVNEKASKEMMGGTLLIVVMHGNDMFWCSVGDSPIYLCRDNKIQQMNEVHSLGQDIGNLVKLGKIDPGLVASLGNRGTLTSVLNGRRLSKMDCPEKPFQVKAGDTILLASDGIETLSMPEISEIVSQKRTDNPADVCAALLRNVVDRNVEGQDNVSVTTILAD